MFLLLTCVSSAQTAGPAPTLLSWEAIPPPRLDARWIPVSTSCGLLQLHPSALYPLAAPHPAAPSCSLGTEDDIISLIFTSSHVLFTLCGLFPSPENSYSSSKTQHGCPLLWESFIDLSPALKHREPFFSPFSLPSFWISGQSPSSHVLGFSAEP